MRSGLALVFLGVTACGVEPPDHAACEPLTGPWVESDGRVNGDIHALAVLADGAVLAGTTFGIVALDPLTREWGERIDFDAPVTSIAVDPADPSRLLAISAGIHESRDGGRTWSVVYPGPGEGMVAFSSGHPHMAFALLGTRALRSFDGGRSWAIASEGLPDRPSALVAGDLVHDDLYATWIDADAVVAKFSFDGGATWKDTIGLSDVARGSGMTLYGVNPMCTTRSHDNGVSWDAFSCDAAMSPFAVAASAGPPEVVYVAGHGRLHASFDQATTFTQWLDFAPIGWPETMVVGGDGTLYVAPSKGSAVLVVSDEGEEVDWHGGGISGEGRRLARTDDGFLYVATTDGVFISGHYGLTWGTVASQLSIAEPSAVVPTVLVAPSDPSVMYVHYERAWTGDTVLARTDNGGVEWIDVGPASAPPAAVDPVEPHVLYWIVDGALAMSEGDDLDVRVAIDTAPGTVTGVFPDRSDPTALLVAAGERVVRIRDRGREVTSIFSRARDLPGRPAIDRIVGVHAARASGELLLGTEPTRLVRRDASGVWSEVATELDAAPTSLTADPTRPDGVFALVDGRIHRSPDLGTTWCPIDDGALGDIAGFAVLPGVTPMLVASDGERLHRIAVTP